ncbi:NME/NM23 family member 8 [Intoshia linei]|uniref:NME/NM23 family member 8 n=1 Tax=Intoshia linei TaxID=1819745 RepID=A0A177BCE5_9BILA|nr:NME/NM23 family member 8 [Intoshia linei]
MFNVSNTITKSQKKRSGNIKIKAKRCSDFSRLEKSLEKLIRVPNIKSIIGRYLANGMGHCTSHIENLQAPHPSKNVLVPKNFDFRTVTDSYFESDVFVDESYDEPIIKKVTGVSSCILPQRCNCCLCFLKRHAYTLIPSLNVAMTNEIADSSSPSSGVLVGIIRGCDCPILIKTVKEKLSDEMRVMDGVFDRIAVKDPEVDISFSDMDNTICTDGEIIILDPISNLLLTDISDDPSSNVPTIAILKPDVVKQGKVDEILNKIIEKNFEIADRVDKTLTEEEARELYKNKSEMPEFEKLIEFMTSGPIVALLICRKDNENAIEEWRKILGPTIIEDAKIEQPDSLRAQYGTENIMNALHGSSSINDARSELGFFFPKYIEKAKELQKMPDRTIAIIRPTAFKTFKDEILKSIEESGFTIAIQKTMLLTQDQLDMLYGHVKEKPEIYDELQKEMLSGESLVLGLAKKDAIQNWRNLIGPMDSEFCQENTETTDKKLRETFAIENSKINPLHGADSCETAEKEYNMFFKEEKTIALIKPGHKEDDEIINEIKNSGFSILSSEKKEISLSIAETIYENCKDRDYYEDLLSYMTNGKTLVMLLSKNNAVNDWREKMGNVDPKIAKTENVDSIRAKYGDDVLKNVVHGSSNLDRAKKELKLLLGNTSEFLEKFEKDSSAQTEEKVNNEENRDMEDEKVQGDKKSTDGVEPEETIENFENELKTETDPEKVDDTDVENPDQTNIDKDTQENTADQEVLTKDEQIDDTTVENTDVKTVNDTDIIQETKKEQDKKNEADMIEETTPEKQDDNEPAIVENEMSEKKQETDIDKENEITEPVENKDGTNLELETKSSLNQENVEKVESKSQDANSGTKDVKEESIKDQTNNDNESLKSEKRSVKSIKSNKSLKSNKSVKSTKSNKSKTSMKSNSSIKERIKPDKSSQGSVKNVQDEKSESIKSKKSNVSKKKSKKT